MSLVRQQLTGASSPENLLLGFCHPSGIMDGWQLDMNWPCLPWGAYPIQHKSDGDHVACLCCLNSLPGDGLTLSIEKRFDGNCAAMASALWPPRRVP